MYIYIYVHYSRQKAIRARVAGGDVKSVAKGGSPGVGRRGWTCRDGSSEVGHGGRPSNLRLRHTCNRQTYRQTDRQTDRKTDRQTDRQGKLKAGPPNPSRPGVK